MMKKRKLMWPGVLLGAWLLAVAMAEEERPGFATGFFVFENGLGFGTAEEEAASLKELGFSGVSQVKAGGEALASQIALYEEKDLKVLSIYLDASEEAVKAETVRPFAGRNALIELTIKKRTESTIAAVRSTCEMAEKMGIKVALYPHHGFALATMGEAMDLIAEVDHPNLGVMFNLCHFLRGEEIGTLEAVIRDAGPRLFAVSVSGAEIGGKDWAALIQPLDQGDFPQERLLLALRESGFQGPVTLQSYAIPGDKLENLGKSIRGWRAALDGLDR